MSKYEFVEEVKEDEAYELMMTPGVKSHFLGSEAWGRVSANRNWTPYRVGVRKDGKLAATALLLKKNLIKGYTYFYIPRGFIMDYSDRELLREVTKMVDAFCRRHKSLYFKIDPDIKLFDIDADGNPVPGGEDNTDLVMDLVKMGYTHKPLNYLFEGQQPRFTFRIPTDSDIDTVKGRYEKIVKRRLKQAAADGVEIVEGTREDIPEFVRLMTMTEKRQGFYAHDTSYYQYFYDIMDEYGMVDLYFAKIDIPKLVSQLEDELKELAEEKEKFASQTSKKAAGKVKTIEEKIKADERQLASLKEGPQEVLTTSAQLLMTYAGKVWTLYAGNDMDYGKFYSNYAMFGFCIEEAVRRGAVFLDAFGTVGKTGLDPALDGLHEFKKRWGGEYTEFIGEFDFIQNKLMYFFYSKLIPIYHKRVNKKLRKKVQEDA